MFGLLPFHIAAKNNHDHNEEKPNWPDRTAGEEMGLYQGKQCVLHINLAPDGRLKSVTSEGGDPALCQAALAAARSANIPKPPSEAVYDKIKDAKLDFKL